MKLSKYKPQAVRPIVSPSVPGLAQLWTAYTDFKRPSLSPHTLVKDLRGVAAALERCPYGLDKPTAIRDWLVQNLPPNRAKRILTQVNACCRWAVESKLIESNPFAGMASSVTLPKGDKSNDEIDPFTPQERDIIISEFEQSQYYRHYAPLVRFLFLTGCRPAEALGLEWTHITDGMITFQQTSVNGAH